MAPSATHVTVHLIVCLSGTAVTIISLFLFSSRTSPRLGVIFDTISVKARWERWCRWHCDLRVHQLIECTKNGQLSVLTLILVSVPPRVTAVAHKRPRSFHQKRRWQVTAKHAYTLHMWLCMKWHGAWLYGVHRTCQDWLSGSRFLWHQPCQHCKYATSVDIEKRAMKSYSLM